MEAKTQKKWIIGIIITIVVIMILLAVLGFKLKQKKKETGNSDVLPTPAPKPPTASNTGITGGMTGINNAVPDLNKTLYKNMPKCIEVERLQAKLNEMGANLDVDGLFGPKTEEALLRFFNRTSITLNEAMPALVTPYTGPASAGPVAEPTEDYSWYDPRGWSFSLPTTWDWGF